MFSSRAALAAAAVVLAGCASSDPAGARRIAILAFDNQTGDPALDRLGADVSRGAAIALGGAPGLYGFSAADSNDASLRRAAAVVNGYFSGSANALRLALSLQDTASGKIEERFEVSAAAANARVVLSSALARRLWPASPGLGTANEEAARLLLAALAEPEPLKAAQLAAGSLAAEPGFAEAAIVRAELLNAAGDKAGARSQVNAALSRSPAPYARARLEFHAATLAGDADRRLAAAVALTKLAPADGDLALRLAQAHTAARDFTAAAASLERFRSIEPGAPGILNQLLYAHGYAGEFPRAMQVFEEYRKAVPRDANPYDSLGEVYFMNGRFADAEARFLEVHQRTPGGLRPPALYKAALARWLGGDRAGASALFDKYAAAMPKHPLTGVIRARWEFLTGRRPEAMARLEGLGKQGSGTALAQLALFRLEAGGDARAAATEAVRRSRTPEERTLAMVALLAAQPDVPPEQWRRRVQTAIPAPSPQREALLGEILFARRHWAAAIPAIEQALAQGRVSPANRWETMLAKSLSETGKAEEARPWLRFWPVPPPVEEGHWDHLVLGAAADLRKPAGAGSR